MSEVDLDEFNLDRFRADVLDGWIHWKRVEPRLIQLADELERLRNQLKVPPSGDGTTHWEGCWETRGHHDCALREVERLRADDKRLRGDLHRKLGNQIGPEIFKAKSLLCSSCSGKGTGLVCSDCMDESEDQQWQLRAERNRLREALGEIADGHDEQPIRALSGFVAQEIARAALPTPEPEVSDG